MNGERVNGTENGHSNEKLPSSAASLAAAGANGPALPNGPLIGLPSNGVPRPPFGGVNLPALPAVITGQTPAGQTPLLAAPVPVPPLELTPEMANTFLHGNQLAAAAAAFLSSAAAVANGSTFPTGPLGSPALPPPPNQGPPTNGAILGPGGPFLEPPFAPAHGPLMSGFVGPQHPHHHHHHNPHQTGPFEPSLLFGVGQSQADLQQLMLQRAKHRKLMTPASDGRSEASEEEINVEDDDEHEDEEDEEDLNAEVNVDSDKDDFNYEKVTKSSNGHSNKHRKSSKRALDAIDANIQSESKLFKSEPEVLDKSLNNSSDENKKSNRTNSKKTAKRKYSTSTNASESADNSIDVDGEDDGQGQQQQKNRSLDSIFPPLMDSRMMISSSPRHHGNNSPNGRLLSSPNGSNHSNGSCNGSTGSNMSWSQLSLKSNGSAGFWRPY